MLEGVEIVIDRYLREDDVYPFEGRVYAGSFSAVLAQIERERRRADVLAVWPPLPDFSSCGICGSDPEWVDCCDCGGEGLSHHDCGEDTCCCLDPEDNVRCDICEGKGGFLICPSADKHSQPAAEEHHHA